MTKGKDVGDRNSDNLKLRDVLNWEPQVPLTNIEILVNEFTTSW